MSASQHEPAGTVSRIDACCSLVSGGTPSKSDPKNWDGTIPWASPKDLKQSHLRDTQDHISEAGLRFGSTLAPAGSVLVVIRGMILARDVPTARTEVSMAFNQDVKAILPGERVDSEYLLCALEFAKARLLDRVGQSAHGTRTLLSEELAGLEIWLPPRVDQERIASTLMMARRAVRLCHERLRITRELKSAAMQKLYTHGLRGEPQKETAIGLVPRSWAVVPLGDQLERAQYGLSVRGKDEGRFPILRMNCQNDGRVEFRDLQFVDLDEKTFSAFRLNDGDLLFNRTNSFELVGRTALFRSARDAVFASYLIRLTLNQEALHPEFVNYYLNMPSTQSDIKRLASRGVSQANISASKLRDYPIPKPSTPEEQREITAALEVIDHKIAHLERKRATLQELFHTLLSELMTGRIRLDSLDIDGSEVEPAATLP